MQNFSPILIDIYPPNYHTCSVYFNYTRFFTRNVRKCQLKGRCFNSINSIFSKTTSISMKVILKDVIAITESKHENEFRVLPCFEDSIFALLKSLTNPLFRPLSGYTRRFSPWRRADVSLTARNMISPTLRRERHFTWSPEPRRDLTVCRAMAVPSFLSYFKSVKRSTDWANPAAEQKAYNKY